MTTTSQTPAEKLAYSAQIASGNDDTIANAVWNVSPSATISNQTFTSTTAICFLSGLVVGTTYILNCLITGATGAMYQGFITIICQPTR